MRGEILADFSRTCAGCEELVLEPWAKGKTGYRCGATGPRRGYTVGIERFSSISRRGVRNSYRKERKN